MKHIFFRHSIDVPPYLSNWDLTLHSSAYKNTDTRARKFRLIYQIQKEAFTLLQRYAFQDDALVMLRYDYLRYLAILIPSELCNHLYSITDTHGSHNINFAVLNPSYNSALAIQLQHQIISKDVMYDDAKTIALQNTLNNTPNAGTDIERIVKHAFHKAPFEDYFFLNAITATFAIFPQHRYYVQVTLKNGLNLPEKNV